MFKVSRQKEKSRRVTKKNHPTLRGLKEKIRSPRACDILFARRKGNTDQRVRCGNSTTVLLQETRRHAG